MDVQFIFNIITEQNKKVHVLLILVVIKLSSFIWLWDVINGFFRERMKVQITANKSLEIELLIMRGGIFLRIGSYPRSYSQLHEPTFFFSVLIIFRQPFRDGFSNKQLLHLLVCNYVLLKLICICYYDLINDRKFMTFVWAFSLKAFTISTLSLWSRKRLKNENYFLCQDSSNARS